MFTFTKTFIDGVIVVEPHFAGDNRGFFCKTYDVETFKKNGITSDFVQDDNSFSTYGVLRGLHYQIKHPQAKLVRVIQGKVFDVAVDLRKGSSTYGKYYGVILDGEKQNQFYIPEGFAHGFFVMSDYAEFCYKCSDFYHPNDEGGLIYNDPEIGVVWPIPEGMELILSDKDKVNSSFRQYCAERGISL